MDGAASSVPIFFFLGVLSVAGNLTCRTDGELKYNAVNKLPPANAAAAVTANIPVEDDDDDVDRKLMVTTKKTKIQSQ